MDQGINALGSGRLTAAMGMAMAGNMTRAADTGMDGQFQKLLEQRSQQVDRPVQSGSGTRENPAQAQDRTPEEQQPTEAPQAEGVQQETQAEPESMENGELVVWVDPVEQSKRLIETGLVVAADQIVVPQQQELMVQQAPEEIVEVTNVTAPEESATEPVTSPDLPADISEATTVAEEVTMTAGELQASKDLYQPIRQRDFRENATPEERALIREIQQERDAAVGDKDQVIVHVDENAGERLLAEARALFSNVDSTPIKVGENYSASQVQGEDVGKQIADQLIPAMNQGETRVEIQLSPESLGTVKIEIIQSESGAVHVAISTESSQTKTLLEKHVGSLQTMLAERSQGPVQVVVRQQEETQQRQDNPYDGHNGQGQSQQQERQNQNSRHSESSRDFLHQLRLGLVDLDENEDE